MFKFRWPASLVALVLICFTTAAMAADPVKVRFFAVSAAGAKPLKEDLNWVIKPAKGTGGETQKFKKPQVETELKPGDYNVTVTIDMATVTKPVKISKAGKQEIVLDIGNASFRMIPTNKGKTIQEDITWTVYKFTKGGPDEKHKVGSVVGSNPQIILPAGFYTVRGKYDSVQADVAVEIKPGIGYKYTVNLYAGKAMLTASANGKAVKDKITWKVMRAAKNKQGGHDVLYTTTEASPTLTLREGKYIVVAKAGDMAGESKLDVKEGQTAKVKVDMKEGMKVAAGS
ncbi:MAG TPA: hypothetical protein VH835_07325 [Dongiaceae bacterium]